jgi:hypothetical protein
MTIGALIIMLIGFSGGLLAGYFLIQQSIDDANDNARKWRQAALELKAELERRK